MSSKAKSPEQKRFIPFIDIGGGYILKPITDEQHIKAFETIINGGDVYKTIRHGEKWTPDLIHTVFSGYINGNARYAQEGYTGPADLGITWLLEFNGEIIGRAGIQPEDVGSPIMSNIAIAIKEGYQGQSLGKRSCKAMIEWFDENIRGSLRWLSTDNNERSIKIALSLGFLPVLLEDGVQASLIKPWGKKYLVFER